MKEGVKGQLPGLDRVPSENDIDVAYKGGLMDFATGVVYLRLAQSRDDAARGETLGHRIFAMQSADFKCALPVAEKRIMESV